MVLFETSKLKKKQKDTFCFTKYKIHLERNGGIYEKNRKAVDRVDRKYSFIGVIKL